MASWPAKDPDDVLDYPLDWSEQMAIDDDDTIADYEVIIEEGTVEVDTTKATAGLSFTDTETRVWLKNGTIGETCEIVNRITTAAGRVYDHTRTLKIKAK